MTALRLPTAIPDRGRTIAGHPPGLFVLFVVEMWERFSYYGNRGLLMLYLVAQVGGHNPGRGLSTEAAGNLFGWYTGLAYFLTIFGGLIADKLIGAHRSVLIGGILIALGHITLAVSGLGAMASNETGMAVFVLGLALIVIGTGHFKPNVSVMVGQIYADGDPRRDSAFTIFYMGINVGAFISAFICGTLGERVGWHWGFGAAAVGMLAGLAVYLVARPRYLQGVGTRADGGWATIGLFALALALSAAVAVAYRFDLFAAVGRAIPAIVMVSAKWLLGAAVVVGAIVLVATQLPGDKGPTVVILLFIIFNAVFWLAYEQGGTSLNLFADDMTRRSVGSHVVPATWFQSVGALQVILLAPVFAALWAWLGKRGWNPSQPIKIALALFLLAGGYLFMVAGARGTTPDHRASAFWLLATYTMLTLGELCISPTGLAFVTRAASVRFVSLMMGLYFLSNSLANWAGGRLAGQIDRISTGQVRLPWHLGGQADFFLLFVVSAAIAGVTVLVLTPLLKWLLGDRAA